MMTAVGALLALPVVLLAGAAAAASAQPLPDDIGFVSRFDVQAGGQTFVVETRSNFHVRDLVFDEGERSLTFHVTGGARGNLAEIIIPRPVLGGNLTFALDGVEISPRVASDERVSFVTLNLTGSGDAVLVVAGSPGWQAGTAATAPVGQAQQQQQQQKVRDETPLQGDSRAFLYACVAVAAAAAAAAVSVTVARRRNRSRGSAVTAAAGPDAP